MKGCDTVSTYFIHGPLRSTDSSRGFDDRKLSKRLANTAAETPPPETPLSNTTSRARSICAIPSSATAVYTAARVPPPEAATTSDGRCASACDSRRVASVSPVARACALSSASVTCSGLMALARTIGSTASGRDQSRCQKKSPAAAATSRKFTNVK